MSTDDLRTLLDEWRAIAAAATPGPWWWDQRGDLRPTPHDEYGLDCIIGWDAIGETPDLSDGDAAFIAASRSALPRLIAAVEAVLTLAEAWRYKGEYGDGPWQLGEGPDESGQALDDASSQLRTAIRAALIGDGDD